MGLRRIVVATLRPILPAYLGRQVENEVMIALRHFWYSHRIRRQLERSQGVRGQYRMRTLPDIRLG